MRGNRRLIDYRAFGRLLADARELRHLSQGQLAHAANIKASLLAAVENGNKALFITELARVRRVLDIDIHPLIRALPVHIASIPKLSTKLGYSHRRAFGQHEAIAREFVRARRRAKIALVPLAASIGLGIRTLVRIEGGHRLPSVERFAQLHLVLGFDANKLLDALVTQHIEDAGPFDRFGAIIRLRRESLGIETAQVARAVRCTEHEYGEIERGVRLPTMTCLIFLHRTLRFDVDSAVSSVWSSDVVDWLA